MNLEKYYQLMKDYPDLFTEDNSLLEIVKEKSTIMNWQADYRNELIDNNYPLEWADIGIVFEDPYNLIIRDLIQFPDGNLGGYTRAVMKASFSGGKGVAILPEYQGKLLLLHQFRHPTRKWHYQVPIGYAELNISDEENARKEISEETGGEILSLSSLGDFFTNPGFESVPVHLFYANLGNIGFPNAIEAIESFVWLTVRELESWIADEIVADGFTIAAFTRAKLKGLI